MDKTLWEETWHTISRFGVVIFVIIMGVAGKFGLYLIGDKKLSWRQLLGSLILAFVVGIVAAMICKQVFPSPEGTISYNSVAIIVLSALFSDRMVLFIMASDKTKLFEIIATRDWNAIFKILTRKNKDKNGKDN